MPSTCWRDVVAVDRVDVEAIEQRRWPAATPCSSWSIERIRPSMNAVVAGLPRSWHTAPSITTSCCGAVEIVDARARLIDDLQRVHPDVAFRMPLGLLRTADERAQLREELSRRRRDRARAQSRSTASAPSSSFSNSPQIALGRQVVERDALAELARVVVERQLEARRELNRRAARAGCRRRTSCDPRRAGVAARDRARPSKRIEILAGERIPARSR